jgi:hypothetical protein
MGTDMSNTPAVEANSADATSTASLVRVEKGHANAEELAAVTALLLARAAAGVRHAQIPSRRSVTSRAGWRRLERQHGFRAPHSWQG